MSETKQVYGAIAAVMADVAKLGIAKERKNQQQGYQFRGIDDVLNALSPVLAKHGLLILPRIIERVCEERQTKSGGTLFYAIVRAEFDFVAAKDGSTHTVTVYGEAMDSADKATNKAMSAAYKYMALLSLCIPVDGTDDADTVTHEPEPKAEAAKPKAKVSTGPVADGVLRHELRKLSSAAGFSNDQRARLVQAAMDESTTQEFAEKLIAKAKEVLAELGDKQDLFTTGTMN